MFGCSASQIELLNLEQGRKDNALATVGMALERVATKELKSFEQSLIEELHSFQVRSAGWLAHSMFRIHSILCVHSVSAFCDSHSFQFVSTFA